MWKRVLIIVLVVLLGVWSGFVGAYTITPDGDPTDWKATTDTQEPNTGEYYSVGEWVWKDATSDLRNEIPEDYVITIDGHLLEWDGHMFAGKGSSSAPNYAKLDRLYVTWNSSHIMFAIKTNNTQNSPVCYGVGIDFDPGSGSGYTGNLDAKSVNVGFGSGYAIDHELYFCWDDGTLQASISKYITGEEGSWMTSDLIDLGGKFASVGDISSGLQTLEVSVPWSAFGLDSPKDFAVISWAAYSGIVVSSAPWDTSLETQSNIKTLTALTDFSRVDIEEFRITCDDSNLYLLIKLRNLGAVRTIGSRDAPLIVMGINDQTSGSSGVIPDPDGRLRFSTTSYGGGWNYQLVVNLASQESGVNGEATVIEHQFGTSTDSLAFMYGVNWNIVSTSAKVGVSIENSIVELSIPWNDIGGRDAYKNLYLYILVGYGDDKGKLVKFPGGEPPTGGPNALDVMSDKGTREAIIWGDTYKKWFVPYRAEVRMSQVPFFSSELVGVTLATLLVISGVLLFRRR